MASREPAVAGIFYPEEPDTLAATVRALLDAARPAPGGRVKALIVPHAGLVYSGPIAATAYRMLEPVAAEIRRVVLLGPMHRVAVRGMAFPSVDAFVTPLGTVLLDRSAINRALERADTGVSDDAHAFEHCLEVQLPFLQTVLESFLLVPFLVGSCPAASVAAVLDALWDGDETLIVVSSDLSHYLPYTRAQARDVETTRAITERSDGISREHACGAYAINGLMRAARAHDLQVHALDVRNSGDTAGDRDRVVGYGAYVVG